MAQSSDAPTVPIKACHACGGELLEPDKFCRWCGVRQDHTANIPFEYGSERGSSSAVKKSNQLLLQYMTSTLNEPRPQPYFRHSVSGPLINELVERLEVGGSMGLCSRAARKAILALVMIPVWLIIILLSPLDAYVAARAVSNRAGCEQGEKIRHRVVTHLAAHSLADQK